MVHERLLTLRMAEVNTPECARTGCQQQHHSAAEAAWSSSYAYSISKAVSPPWMPAH